MWPKRYRSVLARQLCNALHQLDVIDESHGKPNKGCRVYTQLRHAVFARL